MDNRVLIPAERIEQAILLIRGHKVMLDTDLSKLYGVSTKAFNQAVKRNRKRFPEDFMFQLTTAETESLRSQIVTLKRGRGQHRKYHPFAFTEQGVAMLSSVLRSERAVLVNVEIMRAFVRLRQLMATHADLARKLEALEKIRCPVQGSIRCDPATDGAAGAQAGTHRVPGLAAWMKCNNGGQVAWSARSEGCSFLVRHRSRTQAPKPLNDWAGILLGLLL